MWLIKQEVANEMQRAAKAGFAPSPEAQAQFMEASSGGGERLTSVVGGVAEISITGALTPGPSFAAWLFGGGNTSYADIRDALAAADADPSVKRIVLNIDSPGGRVAGFFETVDAIRSVAKPLSVRSSMACSAAYGLASAAGKIEATSEAAEFGSIGVAVTYMVWDDEVDITSSEAPEKRPDLKTEEGKAVVRKHLDQVHDLFVSRIAEGRSKATGGTVDAAKINADYGRGSVMLASAAKRAGLIDKLPKDGGKRAGPSAEHAPVAIAASATAHTSPSPATERDDEKPTSAPPTPAAKQRDTPMNEDELKAQHPGLHAAIVATAKKAGADEALTAERDRVGAHVAMGEASGDMKTALEAIASGDAMTQTLQAKYMAAGLNRADRQSRQTETDAADEAVDGAAAETPEKDLGDQVADALEARLKGADIHA